jgi:hypothetical protein
MGASKNNNSPPADSPPDWNLLHRRRHTFGVIPKYNPHDQHSPHSPPSPSPLYTRRMKPRKLVAENDDALNRALFQREPHPPLAALHTQPSRSRPGQRSRPAKKSPLAMTEEEGRMDSNSRKASRTSLKGMTTSDDEGDEDELLKLDRQAALLHLMVLEEEER